MPNYWILKTEPTTYSWADLVRDGKTRWDGVRNNLALKHIRAMKKGDHLLIYHSGKDKAVVGKAKVASDPYPDPKAKDDKIVVVDIEAGTPLERPVTLAEIKGDSAFKDLALVRMPRLSVMPAGGEQWRRIVEVGGGG